MKFFVMIPQKLSKLIWNHSLGVVPKMSTIALVRFLSGFVGIKKIKCACLHLHVGKIFASKIGTVSLIIALLLDNLNQISNTFITNLGWGFLSHSTLGV